MVGDNQLLGNEEALRSTEDVIVLDQWRHAHRSKGKMSDQKSIVNFRTEAKDKLSYTAASKRLGNGTDVVVSITAERTFSHEVGLR